MVVNNTGARCPPACHLRLTVTCGTTSPQPLMLIDGQAAQMVPNVGFNSSCSLTKRRLATPPQICPANLVPRVVDGLFAIELRDHRQCAGSSSR